VNRDWSAARKPATAATTPVVSGQAVVSTMLGGFSKPVPRPVPAAGAAARDGELRFEGMPPSDMVNSSLLDQ
jgi:hypothetical protein